MASLDSTQFELAIRIAAGLPIRSKPLTTFHLFTALPAELRLKIWKAACTPRVVTILTNTSSTNSNDIGFYSSSPTPALLSVSHEARLQTLCTYRLSFSTTSHPPATYFNPYLDTLYFPRHREMGYDGSLRDFLNLVKDDDKASLNQLRRVAVDVVDVDVKRPWESYNKAQFLRGFKQLKEVVIVMSNNIASTSSSARNGAAAEKSRRESRLVEPPRSPEHMLWAWAMFRHSFMAEERFIEEACVDSGMKFEAFTLPTVKVKEICS